MDVAEKDLTKVIPPKAGGLADVDSVILGEALELADVETVQEITGLTAREAARLVIKYREGKTGFKVRDVFCTRDARALVREVLAILSEYGVTAVGRRALASLTPILSKEEVSWRLSRSDEFIQLYSRIDRERMDKILKILASARFAKLEPERPPLILAADAEERALILRKFGSHVRVQIRSEAEVHELLTKESHVLSTSPLRGIAEITVLSGTLDPVDVCPSLIINYYSNRSPLLQAFLKISELLPEALGDVDVDSARRVLDFLSGLQETPVSLEDAIEEAEDKINSEIKRLMDRGGGMEDYRDFVEDLLLSLADELNLEEDEVGLLRQAAFDTENLPFAFSPSRIRVLSTRRRARMAHERYKKMRETASELEKNRQGVDNSVRRLVGLEALIAVARFAEDYGLHVPQLNDSAGIGFTQGRNLFLVKDQIKGALKVEPVSYFVGENVVQLFGAENKPTVMLTGANSGGKTTLLETLALIHILTLLGLPVPADRACVPLVPLYLFRRRTVRKVGSLEYAIKVLRPIMTSRQPKVLLMDEFEALTEPGALGRIVASILNDLPQGCLTVFVTHLAREILPHLKTPIRVDGIEAKGIDDLGNLIVERQPIFNHLGTSTPHLIISRLAKRAKSKRLQKAYQDILSLLEVRSSPSA